MDLTPPLPSPSCPPHPALPISSPTILPLPPCPPPSPPSAGRASLLPQASPPNLPCALPPPPQLGELPSSLKPRLGDSNKNLTVQALGLLAKLARCVWVKERGVGGRGTVEPWEMT